MGLFSRIVERSFDKMISATGLAVFRIAYCIILLMEIKYFLTYSSLIFDTVPGITRYELKFDAVFIVWAIVVVSLMFGLFTRFSAILNYVFSLVFFSALSTFEYHMDYIYMGVNFLMMIIPMGRRMSLDNLRLKLKHSNTQYKYEPPAQVSQLSYYIIIVVGIALVYWGSMFYKLNSELWLSGNGLWLPASIPQVTILNDQGLLDQKWLMKFIGYFIMVFELALVFVFWIKKFRWFYCIVGIAFHIGIYLEFPIPIFALGVAVIYLLFVPVGCWNRIFHWFKFKDPRLVFYYDEECPLCARTRIVVEHFDIFQAIQFRGVQTYGQQEPLLAKFGLDDLLDNVYSIDSKGKVRSGLNTYIQVFLYLPVFLPLSIILRLPGLKQLAGAVYRYIAANREVERCTEENCGYQIPTPPANLSELKLLRNITVRDLQLMGVKIGLVLLLLLQLNVDQKSLLLLRRFGSNSVGGEPQPNMIEQASDGVIWFSRRFLGITDHGLFLDSHFEGYDKIFAVTYIDENGKEIWLPIIDQKGHPDQYLVGSNWAKWSFRVNNPKPTVGVLSSGVERFTAFYARQEKIDLNDAKFLVKLKTIRLPENFKWEPNYLTEQEHKPWVDYALVHWKGKQFSFELVQDHD